MIHVALGTKAEYIKTAPVLRLLHERGVPFHLVDIGQHGGLPNAFREPLGVPDPDVRLGTGRDAETIGEVVRWSLRLARRVAARRSTVRREVFGDMDGVVLVHGDTPSTLFAALLAKRARLPVAHLESGLRSHSLLHPFPEEGVRIAVMRLAQVLYAPSDEAIANLEAMSVRGETVATGGNTATDAVAHAVEVAEGASDGPGIIAIHRVENLHRDERLDGFVEVLRRAAQAGPCRFLVHPPTERVLRAKGRWDEIMSTGAEVGPLLTHNEFMAACARARWVVTDGGSIQEECAVIGVPTLLWRARTERPDGIDKNVVLSGYDRDVIEEFFNDAENWRRPPAESGVSPAQVVADDLTSRFA